MYIIIVCMFFGVLSCNSKPKTSDCKADMQEQPKKDEVSTETNILIESTVTLVSPSMFRYNYAKEIKDDFDKDGTEDRLVLLADAERDDKGRHIWSHSHIW